MHFSLKELTWHKKAECVWWEEKTRINYFYGLKVLFDTCSAVPVPPISAFCLSLKNCLTKWVKNHKFAAFDEKYNAHLKMLLYQLPKSVLYLKHRLQRKRGRSHRKGWSWCEDRTRGDFNETCNICEKSDHWAKTKENNEVELVSEEVKPGNLHHVWNHYHKVIHLTHQHLSSQRQVSVGNPICFVRYVH